MNNEKESMIEPNGTLRADILERPIFQLEKEYVKKSSN